MLNPYPSPLLYPKIVVEHVVASKYLRSLQLVHLAYILVERLVFLRMVFYICHLYFYLYLKNYFTLVKLICLILHRRIPARFFLLLFYLPSKTFANQKTLCHLPILNPTKTLKNRLSFLQGISFSSFILVWLEIYNQAILDSV